MLDTEFIESIHKMTERELFQLVLGDMNYLGDSYYAKFAKAIRERAEELGVTSG